MKKPSSTNLHQSNQRKKNIGTNNINRHNPKNDHGTMTNFKYVVKKISGLFTLILSGKSKTSSEPVENDSARNNKVRGVSCKYEDDEYLIIVIMFFFCGQPFICNGDFWQLQQQMYHLKVLRVHQSGNLLILQHLLALQVIKLELENFHLRNFIREQENFLRIIRLVKGRLE